MLRKDMTLPRLVLKKLHMMVFPCYMMLDGCFTIHCLPQRGEVDFYFADKFSTDRKELCGIPINVYEIEKEIWNKNAKIWFFKNPFYYWNQEKKLKF